jgi:hypothetical protein
MWSASRVWAVGDHVGLGGLVGGRCRCDRAWCVWRALAGRGQQSQGDSSSRVSKAEVAVAAVLCGSKNKVGGAQGNSCGDGDAGNGGGGDCNGDGYDEDDECANFDISSKI